MMRIAVIIESVLEIGGGFQQQLSTAVILNKHQGPWRFLFYTTSRENVGILKAHGIEARYLKGDSFHSRIYSYPYQYPVLKKMLSWAGRTLSPFESAMKRDRVALVYFLAQSRLALGLVQTNYIVPVLDLCHRDHPEFPEVSSHREFEHREFFYRNVLHKAVAVLTDSDLGRANVIRRYGCDEERVYAAKFLPSEGIKADATVDIRAKHLIKNQFIFYPAQFWAHKNHVYVLEGLDILRKIHGLQIDVVFTGSDRGNMAAVLGYARRLGLEKAVHCVGFVPNEEMASFYKQAVALVMPTYGGPTNIPPLEAFTLGCPVCYSDLPGLRDQVQDAAFLMDLDDPASMAKHIMTIIQDPQAVQAKIKKGKQVLSQWTDQDYWDVLERIFAKYARKMKCWKPLDQEGRA